MKAPSVPCPLQNHFLMPYQYICTFQNCLRNGQQLTCIYCCQQLHADHLQKVQAVTVVLKQFKQNLKKSQFQAGQILLDGIGRCKTKDQLKRNISQLLSYKNGDAKFQNVIDRSNQVQKDQTKKFYENRNKINKTERSIQLQKTVKKPKKQQLTTQQTPFISPILTFLEQDALQQNFQFTSPFCITNRTQKLVTGFTYPPLNRFPDSTTTNVRIQRLTPFWLGIGLSLGKKKYDPESKQHIMLTSNGYINILGNIQQTDVKYCIRDNVTVKYDKRLQIVEFQAHLQKHTVKLEIDWQQDVYLCCVLYYKGDSVQILA